jgi:mutator protein MutT
VSHAIAVPHLPVRRHGTTEDAIQPVTADRPATIVVVVAGVIERHGRLLVSRRLKGTHLADLWEFPGGKCHPDESHEACLARELAEELGVGAMIGDELLVTEHAYPERTVRLHFRHATITGEPRPLLGQELMWVTRRDLSRLEFPEADRDLIKLLSTQKGKPV